MQEESGWGSIKNEPVSHHVLEARNDADTHLVTHPVINWDDLEKLSIEPPKPPIEVYREKAKKAKIIPTVKPQLTKAETRAAEIQSDMDACLDTFP